MNFTYALEGLLLVLSNLAILPAVFYSFYLNLIAEATVLTAVFLVSVTYHLCQSYIFCLLDAHVRTFQLADHFFVYAALVWFLLFFLEVPLEFRFSIFIWIQILFLFFLLEFLEKWWLTGVFIVAIVLVACFLSAFVLRRIPKFNVVDLTVFVVLLGSGFALHLYAGSPLATLDPEDIPDDPDQAALRYAVFHSLWHLLAMFSIYYVIDLKAGNSAILAAFRYVFRVKKKKKKTPPARTAKRRLKPRRNEHLVESLFTP